MEPRAREGGPDESTPADPARLRELAEGFEHLQHQVESLVNRTNTLVHLLDILNKRVDRVEADAAAWTEGATGGS